LWLGDIGGTAQLRHEVTIRQRAMRQRGEIALAPVLVASGKNRVLSWQDS
jgi:hypothetical protein